MSKVKMNGVSVTNVDVTLIHFGLLRPFCRLKTLCCLSSKKRVTMMTEALSLTTARSSSTRSLNPNASSNDAASAEVIWQDLQRCVDESAASSLFDTTAMAVPVAAMKTLLNVVQRSTAETMMGLQEELQKAAGIMIQQYRTTPHANGVALQSGIELFLKYITRTFLEIPNFELCRQLVLQRGARFQNMSVSARDRIAVVAADFIRPNSTILTTGWSRVVAAILRHASLTTNTSFDVIVLEGGPDQAGARAAQSYRQETSIPVTVVPDAAMAYILEERKVTMVLTGADAVVENGGVVNKVGTYAVSLCAYALGIPVYVAAESYKFARLYPLHQSDLPYSLYGDDDERVSDRQSSEENTLVERPLPTVDFTPAKYITLLFTDLGVLTTSAVSDELIRLYQ
jgi:translation initiation factor eIF-2B subunit alpha